MLESPTIACFLWMVRDQSVVLLNVDGCLVGFLTHCIVGGQGLRLCVVRLSGGWCLHSHSGDWCQSWCFRGSWCGRCRSCGGEDEMCLHTGLQPVLDGARWQCYTVFLCWDGELSCSLLHWWRSGVCWLSGIFSIVWNVAGRWLLVGAPVLASIVGNPPHLTVVLSCACRSHPSHFGKGSASLQWMPLMCGSLRCSMRAALVPVPAARILGGETSPAGLVFQLRTPHQVLVLLAFSEMTRFTKIN